MASIDRTAYPRFRGLLTEAELETDFALSDAEEAFVSRYAHGKVGRLSLAVSLKTRQFLGYFPALEDVPDQICQHVAKVLGFDEQTALVGGAARPATVHRYREAIRKHLGSRPFSHGGREVVIRTVHRAAQVMSDPADLISASVEALVKEGIELPAFSNLDRLIGNLRQAIHEEIYRTIDVALSEAQRQVLDALLELPARHHVNGFSRLKETPGPANLKHLRLWIDRLAELDAALDPRPLLGGIPHTKIRQFAAEAKALETGDLRDVCQPGRRHTLLLCLLHQTQTETCDQLVEMFIRRMRRTRNRAVERLHTLQKNQRAIEEELLAVFGQVLRHAGVTDADEELGRNVRQVLIEQGGVESLGAQYHAVTAYHNDNYLPSLWPIHSGNRSTLFRLLSLLTLESSNADTRLLEALEVVRQHQRSRRKLLSVALDLGFAPQRWQAFVQQRQDGEFLLDRHALELCTFMYLREYARFELPKLWGKPNVAIADGTHMDLRENNLLGEQHIRYGRYGGIAYHHISATYIALFSNFIACGVWEAVYILDGLLQNRSEFEVNTVHADTHGQSEPVFGLAYLLGIELLPRMRTWNDAEFYRPDAASKYDHIDALFTKPVDRRVIEAHLQDMMQVVLSIQAGKVPPSMLLRKLGSRSKKNLSAFAVPHGWLSYRFRYQVEMSRDYFSAMVRRLGGTEPIVEIVYNKVLEGHWHSGRTLRMCRQQHARYWSKTPHVVGSMAHITT